MSAPEYEGVVMMNGHRKQEGCYFPYGDRYCPNDLQKVKDMIALVDGAAGRGDPLPALHPPGI